MRLGLAGDDEESRMYELQSYAKFNSNLLSEFKPRLKLKEGKKYIEYVKANTADPYAPVQVYWELIITRVSLFEINFAHELGRPRTTVKR